MIIKKNIIRVKTSATLAINEKSKNLENKGKEIYKFGLGQSPFPVPKIVEKELKKNAHQKDYLNVEGLEQLRIEVAKYHQKKNQYNYTKDNIIIGPGSKELIFQIQLVLKCDLLLPSPSWVSYEPQAKILNKKVHWLKTSAKSNWHLESQTLEKFCKKYPKKQKLLILNSPNNPSGTSHNKLKELSQVAKKYKIIIISDEIYAELDFLGKYKSIAHYYPEGTIISSGLSKWCGAGGWRIGTMIFPKKLIFIKKYIKVIASETFTSVSAPIQYAAIKAYSENHSDYLKKSRKVLHQISLYIYKKLTSIGVECQKTEGGFYILCDFNKIIHDKNINSSEKLCQTVLRHINFAMLPGSNFGIKKNSLITRLAFVDFDGKKALTVVKLNKKFTDEEIRTYFPKIYIGIDKLISWLSNH